MTEPKKRGKWTEKMAPKKDTSSALHETVQVHSTGPTVVHNTCISGKGHVQLSCKNNSDAKYVPMKKI